MPVNTTVVNTVYLGNLWTSNTAHEAYSNVWCIFNPSATETD